MKTWVVVLNWNGWRDTIACLDSLFGANGNGFCVVVCDNGSSDDSLSMINDWGRGKLGEERFRLIRNESLSALNIPRGINMALVDNGKNLGFAGGNNPGIRLALQDPECRYVWLLNNDTVVEPETLPAAIQRMEEDPNIGICGSTLVYDHHRDLVQAFGGAAYSRWTGRSRHIGAFASIKDIPPRPDDVEREMDYVVGASMLVRREFIEQIGLMQEDYFLYWEEIDWATRGRGRFRVGYAPRSIVYHKEGASIGTSASGGSPLSLFYLFRNRIRYAWRFHRAFVPSVLLFCAIDLAKLLVKRRWRQALAGVRGLFQLAAPVPVAKVH